MSYLVAHMEEQEPKHFELFGMKFPVHTQEIIKYSFITWIVLAVILLIAQYFFQYEMTNADIPGGLTAGVLFAYLITVIFK